MVTHLELDELFKKDDTRLSSAAAAVFIQCVGSRDNNNPYCSKVCCTHSMISALELKKRNPDMTIVVLYRDIRTYGTRKHSTVRHGNRACSSHAIHLRTNQPLSHRATGSASNLTTRSSAAAAWSMPTFSAWPRQSSRETTET